MYHEEKVICGVLHWRGTPDGEWHVYSAEQLTSRILELKKELASKEEHENSYVV